MAITFENTPLQWDNSGTEPSESLKADGFSPGYKPAADTFNYQIHNSSACLTELQTKLSGVLDTVDELDQKAIKGIRGSGTLIIPMSDKTVNVTPANIGAAKSTHTHSASDITGTIPIAKGGTGASTSSGALKNLGIIETSLYENPSGSSGTITLSSSINDYSYIDIFYRNSDYWDGSLRVYVEPTNSRQLVSLMANTANEYGSLYFKCSNRVLSGTTITVDNSSSAHIASDGTGAIYENSIYITRVVGHKITT